ncbi:MAG: DUF3450 domain-containing protein [Candidatus Amulumruptor caecigallinarius]|nr:DUF3450 domain-containing protein [Candidatus Amulumruptor caecigallinarius]
MRKYLLFILIFLTAFASVSAQGRKHERNRESMRKEVREFKLKFMAQEMDLKEDQQKKFFEVYNQLDDERMKIFREIKTLERRVENMENASDADYEQLSKSITSAKEKDAEIERKYDEKFATFLSPRQIFKMKKAEESFRHKLHKMHRDKSKK